MFPELGPEVIWNRSPQPCPSAINYMGKNGVLSEQMLLQSLVIYAKVNTELHENTARIRH